MFTHYFRPMRSNRTRCDECGRTAGVPSHRDDRPELAWTQADLDANGGHSPECEGSCHTSCPIRIERELDEVRRLARVADARRVALVDDWTNRR